MDPPSGLAYEIEMQMVEKQGQGGLVFLQYAGNKFSVDRLIAKQSLYRFGPRPIDLFPAHGFVAIAQVRDRSAQPPLADTEQT
jgi:hypothetical protein